MKNSKLDAIFKEIIKRETPSQTRYKKILAFAELIKDKVEAKIEREKVKAEVEIEGSVAKDTWLQGDVDIDIFMLIPENIDRKTLESTYTSLAKESLKELRLNPVERFAEHPYVEAFANEKIRINIVPCYKVTPPNWKSATDRTPYHTEFIKSRLRPEQKLEVRILKRFMKGVEVYGADIKTGGFSGYLTELLIIKYGSFINTMKSASKWRAREIADIEEYYNKKEDGIEYIFDSPLIFIDPVDKHRNVAAAVRIDKFNIFRTASKFFLEEPNLTYFYPKKTAPYTLKQLSKVITTKNADYLFLKISNVQGPPDILWGQIYKTERALRNLLEKFNFKVLRSTCWNDEVQYCIFTFELENRVLSLIKKHQGPPIISNQESEFTKKYIKSNYTISGPYIENERWIVHIKRQYTDAKKLISEKLGTAPEKIGVASRLCRAMKSAYEILENREIEKFYSKNLSFAQSLTKFIIGKPSWL